MNVFGFDIPVALEVVGGQACQEDETHSIVLVWPWTMNLVTSDTCYCIKIG